MAGLGTKDDHKTPHSHSPPCHWKLLAAVRLTRLEFTVHGVGSSRCATLLTDLSEGPAGSAGGGLSCGVLVGSSTTPAYGRWTGIQAWAGFRRHASVPSVHVLPLEVSCAMAAHMAPNKRAQAVLQFHHSNATLAVELPSPPAPVPIGARSPCALRVCTKAYGMGGALTSSRFTHQWLKNWERVGVAEVVVYALEPLPERLHAQLLESPLVRVHQWGHEPYSQSDYEAQQEAQSDIEAHHLVTIGHCVQATCHDGSLRHGGSLRPGGSRRHGRSLLYGGSLRHAPLRQACMSRAQVMRPLHEPAA